MKKKLVFSLALLLICSVFLTACGNGGGDKKESKNMLVGITNMIDKVDPTDGGTPWSLTSYGISETIYKQNEKGELVSRIADEIKQDDDLTWTLTLKKGIKFSNGDAVDAKAIADSLNDVMNGNELATASAGKINFEPVSDLVVKITTERKTTTMKAVLCEWTNIIYKKVGDEYIFTGPYVPQKLDPGSQIELVPNKNYDDKAEKRPNITLKAFKDSNAMKQAFESGELDMAFTVTAEAAKELKDADKKVKDIDAGYQYFAINNTEEGPLSDLKVREAINLTLDREAMTKALEGGKVATGFFAHYYDFAGDVKVKTDVKKAKKILEEAGYTYNDKKQLIGKDGNQMTLTLVTYPSRPDLQIIMQQVAGQLDKIGIKAETKIVDNIDSFLATRAFDIAFYAQHTAPSGDPLTSLNMFFRSDQTGKNVLYKNPDVDKLMDEMGNMEPGKERNKLAKDIQDQVGKDLPIFYLVDPQWHIAVSDALEDYEPYCGDYYVINDKLGL